MTLEELLALLPDNTSGAIDAADLRTIVTELYGDTAELAQALAGLDADLAGLGSTVAQHTTDIGALESRVGALENGISDAYAQVFSYLWVTSPGPAVGKVTVNVWSLAASTVQISETTDDGQALTFAVWDNALSAQIRIVTADGKELYADRAGPSVDQGGFRNLPITPSLVTGAAPTQGQRVTVATIVSVP